MQEDEVILWEYIPEEDKIFFIFMIFSAPFIFHSGALISAMHDWYYLALIFFILGIITTIYNLNSIVEGHNKAIRNPPKFMITNFRIIEKGWENPEEYKTIQLKIENIKKIIVKEGYRKELYLQFFLNPEENNTPEIEFYNYEEYPEVMEILKDLVQIKDITEKTTEEGQKLKIYLLE